MADYKYLAIQASLTGGIYNVLDNKTARKFMQNFRQVGFHPFAFASGQNKRDFIGIHNPLIMISDVDADSLRSDLFVFGIDLDDDRFVFVGFLGSHLAVADDDYEIAGLA